MRLKILKKTSPKLARLIFFLNFPKACEAENLKKNFPKSCAAENLKKKKNFPKACQAPQFTQKKTHQTNWYSGSPPKTPLQTSKLPKAGTCFPETSQTTVETVEPPKVKVSW